MTTYSATYSAEDDKIRLRASSRLDAETYARVKAAGYGRNCQRARLLTRAPTCARS